MTAPPSSDANMRRVLAMYGPAVFAGALATRATDPVVADIALDFGTTAAQAALLGTAYTLPFALVQPILGPVADSVGKRRVVTICVGLLAVMLVASAIAASLGWLMAFRALSGAAAGGMMPLTLAIMADAVPLKDRQVALSRMLVFGISGQIAGGAIAGPVAAVFGWRGMLLLCALAAVAGAVALLLAARGAAPEPVTRYDPVVAAKRYRTILANPNAIPLYLTVAAEGGLVFGSFPFLAPLMIARGIGGTTEAGLAIGAFGVGGLAYAAMARPLLARFGQAGVVRIGGGIGALALLGFAVAPAFWVMATAGFLLGIAFYMIHNAIQTRATELSQQFRGSAVSLHAFSFFSGQSLGPVVFGLGGAVVGLGVSLAVAAVLLFGLAWMLARRPA
ncbi:MFS transporter [Roseomonas fluvialis]|uniref:MFS transporter n=1 Tax=Roseomonas fluvialis TaxID=1750527 RepID=A0ABM7YA76_9PROT|nr:MFS transporter [Roseomonas fluvialis]BDG74991.1 MFS transporter [Roseomonas fluvialis]